MNFVVYEKKAQFVETYKHIIAKLMVSTNLIYQIIEVSSFNSETKKNILSLDGNNIYILDIDMEDKSGIDVAREIRESGDWHSPIILMTNEKGNAIGNISKILMIDLIAKDEFFMDKLHSALIVALQIVNQKKSFCFITHGELYQLPHQDILYIEKCLNNNLSYIVTKRDKYPIRQTIQYLENIFEKDVNFFKLHRSFIVNLENIKHINFETGMITFAKDKQALVSRANKKIIKEKLKAIEDHEKSKVKSSKKKKDVQKVG